MEIKEGTQQSKEVPKRNPLGCISAHWKENVGTGGRESRSALIKYCDQWWPLYKLEDRAKWPLGGTTDYTTML